jgi:hypothetical protein
MGFPSTLFLSAGNELSTTAQPAPIVFPIAESIYLGMSLSSSALTGGSTDYGSFEWEKPALIPTPGSQNFYVLFTPSEFAQEKGITTQAALVPLDISPHELIVGDIDGDRRVTSADATMIARYLVGQTNSICRHSADINADGKVDIADLILLARWLVGLSIES